MLPGRQPLHQLPGRALLVVLMQGDQPGTDAARLHQALAMAGILGRNDIDRSQDALSPCGYVTQISQRRRHYI